MLVKALKIYPSTPYAIIPLNGVFFCKVDPDWFDYLIQFNWFAKKSFYRYYACRTTRKNGRKVFFRMHRIIAETPADQVCHHVNGNTFDNRRLNLQNMSWFEHTKKHSYR